jgi:hypothetical protein
MAATLYQSKSVVEKLEVTDAHRQGIVYHISNSQVIRKLAGRE